MTKVDDCNDDIAQTQLDQPPSRTDLWMFHEALRYDDPDRIVGPGGAIAAGQARSAMSALPGTRTCASTSP